MAAGGGQGCGAGDAGALDQIIYVSVAAEPMSDAALAALLAEARRRNAERGVTGMLLYCDQTFIQVLEGGAATVQALFERIRSDPRHQRVIVVAEERPAERQFAAWSMGFHAPGRVELSAVPGFTDFLEHDSTLLAAFRRSPHAAHRLLLAFRECAGVLPAPGED